MWCALTGPLDLTFCFGVSGCSPALQKPEHRDRPHQSAPCPIDFSDPFAALAAEPLLLHHPYDSFQPVVDVIEAAAADPKVLAIKQTLYRVSGQSPIVQALIKAAMAGKQVTVLCELKARFDEERNIQWARRLERAGAHVLYGVVGYKVHAKLLLIIRREERGLRRYVHIGTGNYNDATAKLYEDFSYLTCNEAIGRDAGKLFNMLTGFSRPPVWERLSVAPLTFRSNMQAWIDQEAQYARKGLPSRIVAKFNSLVDTEMCEHLYAASQAGVQIDLIIRGICILRPGVPGLSENIRVVSVIGRFLEHSRLYMFHNNGRPRYIIGSGDWMTRNLDRRVENLVQVEEGEFCGYFERIVQDYLQDRRNSHVLQADGTYLNLANPDDPDEIGIQARLIAERDERQAMARARRRDPPRFRPARAEDEAE